MMSWTLRCVGLAAWAGCAAGAAPASGADAPTDADAWLAAAAVGSPPEELALDPFYRKHLDVLSVPVVSSDRVSDAALIEAGYLVFRMLHGRPDLARAMHENGTRLAIMAPDEFTTDIPEHASLTPKNYWDRRARGLGAVPDAPVTSCGEENLLQLAGDPYGTENILIHEFAHTIHHMGLDYVDSTFDGRLKAAYDAALAAGLWKGKYAATNHAEYWAEGVQSYFGTNRPPDHDHNHVNTRQELAEYDPALAALIAEVFGPADWTYVSPTQRADQPHLKSLDRTARPPFVWPDRLAEESRLLDEQKRHRAQEAEAASP
jgi:hypothetical protein